MKGVITVLITLCAISSITLTSCEKIPRRISSINDPLTEPQSFLNSLIGLQNTSPLLQMLADVVYKSKSASNFNNNTNTNNTDTVLNESSIGETTMETALHALNLSQVEDIIIPLLNKTNPEYLKATINQIGGELGEGSKFIAGLPSAADISLNPVGLTALAGTGAMALMALSALFHIPVTPLLLRRQGVSKNGGKNKNRGNIWDSLPSFSNLFSWFDNDREPPNPNYIDYANNPYQKSHYEDSEGYNYVDEDEYSNYDETEDNNNYYQDSYQNDYQNYQESSNYKKFQSPDSHNQDYRPQRNEDNNRNQFFQQNTKKPLQQRKYTRPKKAQNNNYVQRPNQHGGGSSDQQHDQSYHVYDTYVADEDQVDAPQHMQQMENEQQKRRPGQRVAQRRMTSDGYTYVSLNQVNRIADESLTSLVEHYEKMQNLRFNQYSPEDSNNYYHNSEDIINKKDDSKYYVDQQEPNYNAGNFFTEEDAVLKPTLTPLQREQEKYIKAYESMYSSNGGGSDGNVQSQVGTQPSAKLDRKTTTSDHITTSTKEFPYIYQDQAKDS